MQLEYITTKELQEALNKQTELIIQQITYVIRDEARRLSGIVRQTHLLYHRKTNDQRHMRHMKKLEDLKTGLEVLRIAGFEAYIKCFNQQKADMKEAHATLDTMPLSEVMQAYKVEKKQGKLKRLNNTDELSI